MTSLDAARLLVAALGAPAKMRSVATVRSFDDCRPAREPRRRPRPDRIRAPAGMWEWRIAPTAFDLLPSRALWDGRGFVPALGWVLARLRAGDLFPALGRGDLLGRPDPRVIDYRPELAVRLFGPVPAALIRIGGAGLFAESFAYGVPLDFTADDYHDALRRKGLSAPVTWTREVQLEPLQEIARAVEEDRESARP